MALIRLVYASRSQLVEANRPVEVDRIVASARRLNELNAVTGCLIVTNNSFAQVLEGEQRDVAETYGRIVIDPRHNTIRLLADDKILVREFGSWSMHLIDGTRRDDPVCDRHGLTAETDLPSHPVASLLALAGDLARDPAAI